MRAYANRCADVVPLHKKKAMRRVQNSAAFILFIILLGIYVSSKSVSSSRGSADALARRVITNELRFQDDQSNWMYRLEKEQYGKKRVEEIIETREGSVSRLLSINDQPLTAKQQEEENHRVQGLVISRSARRKLKRDL